MPIVTKASLLAMLNDEVKRVHVIGRALIVLFNNQTESEKAANATKVNNMVGFAGPDARQGTLSAKYYIKHKTLLPWQVDMWMKDFRGMPRIVKYSDQLNAAAERKASCRQGRLAI